MRDIQWRETAQRYGAPIETAFVGNMPVATVGYALRDKGTPAQYVWTVVLPVPVTLRGTMSGVAVDAVTCKGNAQIRIRRWFRETT